MIRIRKHFVGDHVGGFMAGVYLKRTDTGIAPMEQYRHMFRMFVLWRWREEGVHAWPVEFQYLRGGAFDPDHKAVLIPRRKR